VIGRARCRATEEQVVRILLGTLTLAERIDVERHLAGCAQCARNLRTLERAESAYGQAFAGLRSRRAHIAPGRARLAAAPDPRIGLSLSVPARLLRFRLAEAALAFGVMTLAIVGAEPPRATVPSQPPAPIVLPIPTATAPQPEDPQRSRAGRVKHTDASEIVFRVTPGSPY
jgi:anti-sigma factor RsiW